MVVVEMNQGNIIVEISGIETKIFTNSSIKIDKDGYGNPRGFIVKDSSDVSIASYHGTFMLITE